MTEEFNKLKKFIENNNQSGEYIIEKPEDLDKIEILEFENVDLPESIGLLKNLQSLYYNSPSNNTLLPKSISELKNLKELSLTGYNTIPEIVRSLTGLENLKLDDNEDLEIPTWLGELTNLKELDLEQNSMKKLPECIKQLKNLERLDLELNDIESLPEWIGELTNLKLLYVDKNVKLPESIKNLTNLEKLSAGELPDYFRNFKKLTVLNLESSNLSNIPEWISELEQLKSLDLNYSRSLTNLPESLSKLDLSYLNIAGTKIKQLPYDLKPELIDASTDKFINLHTLEMYEKIKIIEDTLLVNSESVITKDGGCYYKIKPVTDYITKDTIKTYLNYCEDRVKNGLEYFKIRPEHAIKIINKAYNKNFESINEAINSLGFTHKNVREKLEMLLTE